MNPTIFLFLALFLGGFYVASPRLARNIFYYLFMRNSFVVVIIRATATRNAKKWFVIPNAKDHFLTKIGKGMYDLSPVNEAYKRNNRSYFICNQEDEMPLKLREIVLKDENIFFRYGDHIFYKANETGTPLKLEPRTDDDYVFGSERIKEGYTSKSHRALHGTESQLTLLLAGIAVIIALASAAYVINYVQHAQPLIDAIYAKVTSPDQITISPLPTPNK